jgi:hypothetical protein
MPGNQAEFERRLEDARALFLQAWDVATNDYEASRRSCARRQLRLEEVPK